MEQQTTSDPTSTPPLITTESEHRLYQVAGTGYSTPRESPDISPSLPASQSQQHTPQSQPAAGGGGAISTSEPSLRFPRPVGNTHLANWISTSNPDIMRISSHPAEDSGLADSAYEVISAADDNESWSQDGNDPEYISESTSSLDLRRADDVHSIADTETLSDDEYNPIQDYEAGPAPSPSPAPTRGVSYSSVPEQDGAEDDAEETEDDTSSSRSSLEYTQQSLGTPSIIPPDGAVGSTEDPALEGDDTRLLIGWSRDTYVSLRAWLKEKVDRLQSGLADGGISPTHPAFIAMAVIQVVVLACLWHVIVTSLGPAALDKLPAAVPGLTGTAADVAEQPVVASSSTQSASSAWALATAHSTTSLTLREEDSSSEWFFAPKKPEVSFSSVSPWSFLARVPGDVMETWTANDCVTFTASRDGEPLDTDTKVTGEGLVIKFPRSAAHGIVHLALEATCKPGIRKVVKVRFGKGILSSAVQMTSQMATDVIHATEGKIGSAVKALGPVRDTISKTVHDSLRSFRDRDPALFDPALFENIKEDLSTIARSVQEMASEHLGGIDASAYINTVQEQAAHIVRDTQTTLQLELLNAQILAKIGWLTLSGKTAERDEYRRKAAIFMEEKRAAAEKKRAPQASTGQHGEASGPWSSWWEYLDPRFQPGEIFACE